MRIVLVPGWSAGGSDSRWNFLEKTGLEVVRVDFGFQKNKSLLNDYTFKKCVEDVEKEITEDSIIVAKSFGGLITLLSKKKVKVKILLAPGVFITSEEESAVKHYNTPFKKIMDANIGLTKEYLKSVKVKIIILQGTEDKTVKPENSKKISELLNAKLVLIENGTHRFKTREEQEIILKTINQKA